MGVEKMSVSFDLELGEAIRTAASESDESVSAWLAEAARDRLRNLALGLAIEEWEREYGALTEQDLDEADRLFERAARKSRRKQKSA